MDFWHHNMSLKSLRNGLLTPQYESIWVFWHHNMSQYESQITQKWTFDTTLWVASPIYALLSVIRQQMSSFDPFRGGVAKRGQCPPFFTVFFKWELRKLSFPNLAFRTVLHVAVEFSDSEVKTFENESCHLRLCGYSFSFSTLLFSSLKSLKMRTSSGCLGSASAGSASSS